MKINFRRYIYIFLLSVISTFKVNAQAIKSASGIFPPSPTAASFARMTDMNVNLYSGTPQIEIPIYSLKGRNLLTSVGLKYTGANGIKIQEVAGPASLGWTLMAGAVLTRTVRGGPDEEQIKGYCNNNAITGAFRLDTMSNAFKNALRSLSNSDPDQDTEPDVFTCSIGGRIVFNSDKIPNFINQQGFLLKKNGLFDKDSTWVIIDTKGNKYLFGKNANEREHSMSHESHSTPLSNTPDRSNYKFYISSWYLSEIRSPDGEVITFSYEKGKPINYSYYSNNKVTSVGVRSDWSDKNTAGTEVHILDPVYLKNVKIANRQMTFFYHDRWDIAGQKSIEKIIVADLQGNINAAFRFRHGYLKDKEGNAYARAKLLGVEQLNDKQNQYIKIAEFKYNESELLPARSSFQFDHWGYYNSNTTGFRLKSEGAVKDPDPTKCQVGVLTSIEWPSGGRTEYEYEPNSFLKSNRSYIGGGLRISRVKQVERNNSTETKYTYLNEDNNTSSGLLQSRFNPDSGYISISKAKDMDLNAGDDLIIVESDLPMFQLLDLNGVSVGYSRVVVTYPNKSKEVQIFQNYDSFPDKVEGLFLANNFYFKNVTKDYSPSKYGLFSFYTPEHQQRGLIKEKRLYKSNGTIIEKVLYTYNSYFSLSSQAPVAIHKKPYFAVYDASGQRETLVFALHREISNTPQLTSEKKILYNAQDASIATTNFVRNQYKSSYPFLLDRQIMSLSNGDSTVIAYTYPSDINDEDVGMYMNGLNIFTPIEKVTKNKNVNGELVTNAVLNLYQGTADKILPLSVNALKTDRPISDYKKVNFYMGHDSRCREEIVYDLFGKSGELLQYHQTDGVPISIIWGYSNQFPVAKLIGANYSSAVQYVDTVLLNKVNISELERITELNKLRYNLPGAFVTTISYNSATQVSSETDPAGRTQYYEYDEFFRLKDIKDFNGNIIKHLDYHYGSDDGWRDTEIKRCLKGINGQYTGEEEVQQINFDKTSVSYNQVRWRSLGNTFNCTKPIYVKLFLENESGYAITDEENGTATVVDLVARFYEDAACTIPQYIREINLSYVASINPNGVGSIHISPHPMSDTVSVHGTSFVIKEGAIIKEQSDFGTRNYYYHAYGYSLSPGSDYIVVK